MKKRLAAVIPALFLSACGTVPLFEQPNELAQKWTERMQQYRIIPVFPPREDIQVGDIYLACLPKRSGDQNLVFDLGEGPAPLWVASAPKVVGKGGLLEEFYATRVAMPETRVVETNKQGDDGNLQKVAYNASKVPVSDTVFQSGVSNRLRVVSFPEFFSVKASGGGISGLIPTPAVLAGFAVSADQVESISVSIPVAESYGLPAAVLDRAIKGIDADTMQIMHALRESMRNRPKDHTEYCNGETTLIAVSEVFAARAINVQMNFSESAAAKLDTALYLDPDSTRAAVLDVLKAHYTPQQQKETVADQQNGAVAPGAETTAVAVTSKTPPAQPVNVDKSAALIRELNTLIASVDSRTKREYPGVTISAYRGATAGITMVREFSNPVVVGYRGVTISTVMPARAESPTVPNAPKPPEEPAQSPTIPQDASNQPPAADTPPVPNTNGTSIVSGISPPGAGSAVLSVTNKELQKRIKDAPVR